MLVLNPPLYNALKTRFGAVKIASPGERFVAHQMRDPYNPNKVLEECLYAGEYYCVCCPYCGDERFRLWVNHRWNSRDEKTGQITGRHLIICYNEECDLSQFYKELLFFRPGSIKIGTVNVQGTDAEIFKPATMPGRCVPINSLPAWHPAVNYLLTKRTNPLQQVVPFDPEMLWKDWGVCYCEKADHNKGYAAEFVENRLIFPIFRNMVMVGWQARAIDDSTPKYYTMPGTPKRHLLVNGDRARAYPVGILVEGFFDALAVGQCAVASLGKSLSPWQLKWLADNFREGMVCFLLDPDAAEQTYKYMSLLRTAFRYGCFAVMLPAGYDAGNCTRPQLWKVIRDEATKLGLTIP